MSREKRSKNGAKEPSPPEAAGTTGPGGPLRKKPRESGGYRKTYLPLATCWS